MERSLCLGVLGHWFPGLTDEEMDCHLLPGPGRVWQHAKLVDVLGDGREKPPFCFSLVRNPWAQVASEIAYFQEHHSHFAGMNWKEAIRKLVTEPAFLWGHDFQPQVSWMLNERGDPDVDFVGRTERLEAHFGEIWRRLGRECPPLERELPASRGRPPFTELYDEESRNWVAQRFAADISVFGYEFPEDGVGCPDPRPLERQELAERYWEWRAKARHSVLSARSPLKRALPDRKEEARKAAARYAGLKAWGWYLDDFAGWRHLVGSEQPVRALEIGGFDGVSANLMLDCLFPHPASEVHCIDPFEPDPTTPQVNEQTRATFLENALRGGHGDRLKLHEGLSVEVLAWMLSTDGFWESFDFIYVDGSHAGKDVLTDAVMAWNLLKPGGILAFDDYEWACGPDPLNRPKAGIDAFSAVFAPRLNLLRGGWRRIWQKC